VVGIAINETRKHVLIQIGHPFSLLIKGLHLQGNAMTNAGAVGSLGHAFTETKKVTINCPNQTRVTQRIQLTRYYIDKTRCGGSQGIVFTDTRKITK
jgi:hypothetical protein